MIIRYGEVSAMAAVYVAEFRISRPPGPAGNGRRSTVVMAEKAAFKGALNCLMLVRGKFGIRSIEFADPGERLAFLRHLSDQGPFVRTDVLTILSYAEVGRRDDD